MSKNWHLHVGEGWWPVVIPAVELIEAKGGVVRQVKEKFGGLRLYCDGGEEIQAIATQAERACDKLCEVCGAPGELRGGNWIRTTCDLHSEGRKTLKEIRAEALAAAEQAKS